MLKLKHYTTHFKKDFIILFIFQYSDRRHSSLADPLMFRNNHRNLTLLHVEGLNVLRLPGLFHTNHRRIPRCSLKRGLIQIVWIFFFKSIMIYPIFSYSSEEANYLLMCLQESPIKIKDFKIFSEFIPEK